MYPGPARSAQSREPHLSRDRAWRVTIAAFALVVASPSLADTGRVYPNAESVEPIAVGQSIPAVLVRSIDNEPFQLAKIARDSGALLVFYRGGW